MTEAPWWVAWGQWILAGLLGLVVSLLAGQWASLAGRVAVLEAGDRAEVTDRVLCNRELAGLAANQLQVMARLEQIRVDLAGVGLAVAAHVGPAPR